MRIHWFLFLKENVPASNHEFVHQLMLVLLLEPIKWERVIKVTKNNRGNSYLIEHQWARDPIAGNDSNTTSHWKINDQAGRHSKTDDETTATPRKVDLLREMEIIENKKRVSAAVDDRVEIQWNKKREVMKVYTGNDVFQTQTEREWSTFHFICWEIRNLTHRLHLFVATSLLPHPPLPTRSLILKNYIFWQMNFYLKSFSWN